MGDDERGRRLAGAIVESFRTSDLEAICLREGISQEDLLGLRDVFVSAGTARVQEIVRPGAWHQAGVTFDGLGLGIALFLTGRFPDRARAWLDGGVVDRFSFLHKPPGMRLRFRALQQGFVRELSACLDDLVREGDITGWSRGVYEAESHQFGGEIGMDIVHELFTAESLAVLAHRRLSLTGGAALSSPEISLFLLNDFFMEVVEDRWELWDLWSNLALAGRVPAIEGADLDRALEFVDRARASVLDLLDDPESVLARASGAERAVLAAYRARARPIARRLVAARDEGALSCGPRSILPFWIVFHWNRMGFDIDQQGRLAFLMIRAIDPKRPGPPP